MRWRKRKADVMEHFYTSALGFLSGMGASAGTFAFILVIGVVPRIMFRLKIDKVLLIENVIISGAILGNVISILPWLDLGNFMGRYVSSFIIILYGFATGIFVGCIAVALAEILHTFPILFDRLNINIGLTVIIVSMALGKMAGALFYFWYGYAG